MHQSLSIGAYWCINPTRTFGDDPCRTTQKGGFSGHRVHCITSHVIPSNKHPAPHKHWHTYDMCVHAHTGDVRACMHAYPAAHLCPQPGRCCDRLQVSLPLSPGHVITGFLIVTVATLGLGDCMHSFVNACMRMHVCVRKCACVRVLACRPGPPHSFTQLWWGQCSQHCQLMQYRCLELLQCDAEGRRGQTGMWKCRVLDWSPLT